jgi:hypothetical protein
MMKVLKPIFYIFVPLLCAAAIGTYFGYSHYFEELKHGSDDVEAIRWAFFGGLLLSPIGLAVGLVIDLFVWLVTNSPKTQKVS